jgi:hypothetical protein
VAKGHALGDPIGVGLAQNGRLAQGATARGPFGFRQMAEAGVTTQDFAGGRNLKPLRRGFLRFDTFWATHIKISIQLQKSMNYTWHSSGWQAPFFEILFAAGRIQELRASVVLDYRRGKQGVWPRSELIWAGFCLSRDKSFHGGARAWADRWLAGLWAAWITI